MSSSKNLKEFLKQMPPMIAKEHGIPEMAIKKAVIASLSWFLVNIHDSNSQEEAKLWADQFQEDLKREGIKIMMEDMMNSMDSEDGMKKVLEGLAKKMDDNS